MVLMKFKGIDFGEKSFIGIVWYNRIVMAFWNQFNQDLNLSMNFKLILWWGTWWQYKDVGDLGFGEKVVLKDSVKKYQFNNIVQRRQS